jgi:hypothetical protein
MIRVSGRAVSRRTAMRLLPGYARSPLIQDAGRTVKNTPSGELLKKNKK